MKSKHEEQTSQLWKVAISRETLGRRVWLFPTAAGASVLDLEMMKVPTGEHALYVLACCHVSLTGLAGEGVCNVL